MFVGREEELGALERLYRKSGFQMVVLYGRRRVGKRRCSTSSPKESLPCTSPPRFKALP